MMTNCINEKKCHDNCSRCDEFIELQQRLEVATKNLVAYKHDRQDLLEANWNLSGDNQELKRKIEKANEQIKCEIDELYTLKNIYVEIKNDYEKLKADYNKLDDEFIRMCNHAKTLEAVMPKGDKNETNYR